jgi:hypothetical protein
VALVVLLEVVEVLLDLDIGHSKLQKIRRASKIGNIISAKLLNVSFLTGSYQAYMMTSVCLLYSFCG